MKDISNYLFGIKLFSTAILMAVFFCCYVYGGVSCPECEKPKKSIHLDTGTISEFLNRAKQMKKSIKIPCNLNPEIKAEAKEVYKTYQSKEFQAKIKGYEEELKRTLFKNQVNTYKRYYSELNKNVKNYLLPDEKIYIFISSGVPMSTLRNYALEVDRLRDPNIVMVMRGFVNGMKLFRPTLEFLEKLLVKNPSQGFKEGNVMWANIEINPLLFRKYGINRVPAFVYIKGKDSYIIYGDVSLKYAVKKFAEETHSRSLELIGNNS